MLWRFPCDNSASLAVSVFFLPKWVEISTQMDPPARAWVEKVPGRRILGRNFHVGYIILWLSGWFRRPKTLKFKGKIKGVSTKTPNFRAARALSNVHDTMCCKSTYLLTYWYRREAAKFFWGYFWSIFAAKRRNFFWERFRLIFAAKRRNFFYPNRKVKKKHW